VAEEPPAEKLSLCASFTREQIAEELAPHVEVSHILIDEVDAYEPGISATAWSRWTAKTLGLGVWYKGSTVFRVS